MNPLARTFWEHLLTRNMVFVLFVGLLLPVVSGHSIRRSIEAGVKHAVTLLLALQVFGALNALLPGELPAPALALLLSLLAAQALRRWGELQGDWAGIPRTVLALPPYAGAMLHARHAGLAGLDGMAAAFGMAAGFLCGTVVVAALIEQIRIAEAPEPFRRIAALCLAMALFALALAGFQFL